MELNEQSLKNLELIKSRIIEKPDSTVETNQLDNKSNIPQIKFFGFTYKGQVYNFENYVANYKEFLKITNYFLHQFDKKLQFEKLFLIDNSNELKLCNLRTDRKIVNTVLSIFNFIFEYIDMCNKNKIVFDINNLIKN